MKKLLTLILTCCLAMAVSTSFAQKKIKIVADSGAKGSPSGNAIEKWAKLIEEGTDGEIKPRVFYQNQLGGQLEVFDSHMAGDIELMLSWPSTTYDKRIGVIYTPYMFSTWEDAMEAYSQGGWLNNLIDSIYKENGLKFFGAWPEGFNGIATKDEYATSIEQAKNIKVRVPPIFPFGKTIEAMGYKTADIDWGEMFTSLQTGVVDGDAANVIFYDYEYFKDILNYYVRSKQQFITGVLSMNLGAWEDLNKEQQKVIQSSAEIIMKDQFQAAQKTDQEIVDKWTSLGKKYFELNDDQIAPIAKNVREKIWPLMAVELGDDIMQQIKSNAVNY